MGNNAINLFNNYFGIETRKALTKRTLANFSGNTNRSKRISILMENSGVQKNQELAQKLDDLGCLVAFQPKKKLITEGESDDDVFFLISGSVDIIKTGKGFLTNRVVPQSVGEMGAMDAKAVRSATVRAGDIPVIALKISSSILRELVSEFPAFGEGLSAEVRDRQREGLEREMEPLGGQIKPFEYMISVLGGVCVGIVTYHLIDGPNLFRISASAVLSILSYPIFLIRHPGFRYFRLLSLWVIAPIPTLVFPGFSGYVGDGNETHQFAFGTTFPDGFMGYWFGVVIVLALLTYTQARSKR